MRAKVKPNRKIGRPRKYESEGKRPTLTFRVRGSLYDRLQREAKISDKSLSEVIENSLDRYFETRDQYNELSRIVGLAIASVEASEGRRYFECRSMRLATRSAIDAVLDVLLTRRIDEEAERTKMRAKAPRRMKLTCLFSAPEQTTTLSEQHSTIVSSLSRSDRSV